MKKQTNFTLIIILMLQNVSGRNDSIRDCYIELLLVANMKRECNDEWIHRMAGKTVK